jgi:hypothetical protein
MARRPNVQGELRLVSEWLHARRADHWFQMRVRLGDLPRGIGSAAADESEREMLRGAFARWADAIVELPDRTELIEAKIVAHPESLGQLDLYRRLLPLTPTLSHRKHLPVTPVLLYAVPDAMVLEVARERGIMTEQYRPPWVDEYLATLAHRKRTAPLPQQTA